MRMTKCDFCKYSKPNGKCGWNILKPGFREYACEKAIKKMENFLKIKQN